jgi:hypothetical protein
MCIIWRPKVTDLGDLVKSINLKEGTRLQLQRRFYQTAPICNLRQIVHIYPRVFLKNKNKLPLLLGRAIFYSFSNVALTKIHVKHFYEDMKGNYM